MQSTVIDMTHNENFDNIVQELRRGVIVLAVLTQLQEELYGYTLLKRLSEKGLDVDQGTLYPLLRRLESQGLLDLLSALEEARPRRYYILSQAGKLMMPRLIEEWRKINTMLETMAALRPEDETTNLIWGYKLLKLGGICPPKIARISKKRSAR